MSDQKQKISGKVAGAISGFTLIELVIAMAVIVIVAGIALNSLGGSQSFQIFNNNFEKLFGMINNARSMAISGKGQLDYTDADNDGCTDSNKATGATCTVPDHVTPANYGVYFNSSGTPNVELFSDTNPPTSGVTGAKGSFDVGTNYIGGDDTVLGSLILPSNLSLGVMDGTDVISSSGSIFFSPNYADISFENLTATPFLNIELKDSKSTLCRMISIHKLAGVPEVKACP